MNEYVISILALLNLGKRAKLRFLEPPVLSTCTIAELRARCRRTSKGYVGKLF